MTTAATTSTIRTIKPRIAVAEKDLLPVLTTPLHTSDTNKAPAFWLVGAHGGAGVSTLAQVWEPAGDAGKALPSTDEFPGCVIVSRSTITGLEAAHNAILQVRGGQAGNCHLIGCVVVADAPGKLPKAIRQKIRVLEEITTIWKIPFLSELRTASTADLASWEPGEDKEPARRKTKITEALPKTLTTTGEQIFTKAFELHTQNNK